MNNGQLDKKLKRKRKKKMLCSKTMHASSVVTKNEPNSVAPAVIVFIANPEVIIISGIENNYFITWRFL